MIAATIPLLCGCRGSGAANAETDLRPLVAAERQCAPLLSGSWPTALGAETLRAPSVDVLVAAGLIQRNAEPAADPLARPKLRISVTPAGRSWIELRQLNAGGNATPFLCYGQRELVNAIPVAGNERTARYRFRVVNAAAWTRRDDIRATFPFLATALSGLIEASSPAFLDKGKWRLPEHSAWDPGVSLSDKGFYPCAPNDREKACG